MLDELFAGITVPSEPIKEFRLTSEFSSEMIGVRRAILEVFRDIFS